jgi:hypothetical protein
MRASRRNGRPSDAFYVRDVSDGKGDQHGLAAAADATQVMRVLVRR